MTQRELVFIHGRAQQFKDAEALKTEWIAAFREGLAKAGLSLPLAEEQIRFPYYGQALHDLVHDASGEEAAPVIVRGEARDEELERFAADLLGEIQERYGLSDEELRQGAGDPRVVERGVLNWGWVQGILQGLDRLIPGASGASVALFTHDVYRYLSSPGLQTVIDGGVRAAFDPAVETVVVSHSLGTVVAYNVLRAEADATGWRIPLHVTLGSPLGIQVIKKRLRPLGRPRNVEEWFNAMDERDVVALYPLTPAVFAVEPPIENKTDVDNSTPNHHGIAGYLNDAEVARRIHQALTRP